MDSVMRLLIIPTIISPVLFSEGTFLSPLLAPIIIPLTILIILILIDLFILRSSVISFVTLALNQHSNLFQRLMALPLITLMLFAIINALTYARLIPLNDLKERVADTQKLLFPMFDGNPAPLFFIKEVAVESFNFIFSLHSIVITIIIAMLLVSFFRPTCLKKYHNILVFMATAPLLLIIKRTDAENIIVDK